MIETVGLVIGNGKRSLATVGDRRLCAGRLVCLTGDNGSGKSTLLRTLSGLQQPISGKVRVCGDDISSLSPREIARRIAVVLTTRQETSRLTVREMVESGRAPYTGYWGRLTADDEHTVQTALDAVGMTGMDNRRMSTLSDGESQKIMIAKALAQQTPVILLDEPTAFIDYRGKKEVLGLLLRLAHEEHKAVLMSTHDLDLALKVTDEEWNMSDSMNPTV